MSQQQYFISATSPFTRKLLELADIYSELNCPLVQGSDAHGLLFLREQAGPTVEDHARKQAATDVAAKLQEAHAWFADLGIAVLIHQGRIILQQEADWGDPPSTTPCASGTGAWI
jgi:hypothetical protein